jgi:hypothetical protein
MPKFRKKPVVIEARRFDVTSKTEQEALAGWCGGLLRGYRLDAEDREIEIQTLEGDMRAEFGDWIIRGIKGEFYPCKPDIFEATYDLVEEKPHD